MKEFLKFTSMSCNYLFGSTHFLPLSLPKNLNAVISVNVQPPRKKTRTTLEAAPLVADVPPVSEERVLLTYKSQRKTNPP